MDSKFIRAWLFLGTAYMESRQMEAGIGTFRTAAAVNPEAPLPYKFLAWGLNSAGRRAEAIRVWQDVAKIAPEDPDVAPNLGNLFLAEGHFVEALPYLEAAVKLYQNNSQLLVMLGNAWLQSGADEKAAGIFAKALAAQPDAGIKNDIAYAMANANKRLDDALRYAQEAVRAEEEASLKVDLNKLVVDDLVHTRSLGAYWDTLGWVYFRKDDLKQADDYLYAAWTLRQDPIVGYHLAQAYEKQQRKQEAIHMYRFIANIGAAGRGPEDLEAISVAKKQLAGRPPEAPRKIGTVMLPDNPGEELSKDRTASLPKLATKQATAEFFLTFAPATGHNSAGREAFVEDTRFVSGSDLLRSAGEALHKSHFKMTFPQDGSARLVRRGILACFPLSGCSVTLIPVNEVRQVD